jgi:hypothetical protein
MTISTWARDTLLLSRRTSEFCALFGNNPKCRSATNSSRYVYTREDALRIFYRIQLY